MQAMKVKLLKWGNSNAVRIPRKALSVARIKEGDELRVQVERGRITIELMNAEPTLAELVAGITKKNRYKETDTGKARGREVW